MSNKKKREYGKCPNCRKMRLEEYLTATTKVHECVACGYLMHWRRTDDRRPNDAGVSPLFGDPTRH